VFRSNHPTVVSTFASPHEPTLQPKLCQRACKANPITAFQDGLGFAHAQKNKINWCSVAVLFLAKKVPAMNRVKKGWVFDSSPTLFVSVVNVKITQY